MTVGLFMAALPLMLTSFQLFQVITALIMGIAILGLNVVAGYGGQVSLGHGAFVAAGSYGTAILMSEGGWPHWATLPAVAVICAGMGYGVGLLASRLAGPYLALATFAVAATVPQLLKHPALARWTGGVQGIVVPSPDAPWPISLAADTWMYGETVVLMGLSVVLVRNLTRSRFGLGLQAVRDHGVAAAVAGINAASVTTRAFAFSAALTGVAGSLFAASVEFVAPDSFGLSLSISLFVGMVVGGVGSIAGSLFGGAFIVFVPPLAGAFGPAAPGVVYGAALIAVLLLLPHGFAGLLRRMLPQ